MLLGVTSHLMGWVQTFVDRWSTDESDDVFTPRRNMYLYGIGYAAASIDCTAAAVLPFVIYLSTLDGPAIPLGLGALMLGLLVLMIMVTVIVSMGRQSMVGFLRRATGTIKLVGSWMMIFAGIGLSIFLTRPTSSTSSSHEVRIGRMSGSSSNIPSAGRSHHLHATTATRTPVRTSNT